MEKEIIQKSGGLDIVEGFCRSALWNKEIEYDLAIIFSEI